MAGGVVGLTGNPAALSRWLVCAPEIAQTFDEFESTAFQKKSDNQYHHHTETLAEQVRMQRMTKAVIEAIDDFGNPFEEVHNELIALNSHDCTNSLVIDAFD